MKVSEISSNPSFDDETHSKMLTELAKGYIEKHPDLKHIDGDTTPLRVLNEWGNGEAIEKTEPQPPQRKVKPKKSIDSLAAVAGGAKLHTTQQAQPETPKRTHKGAFKDISEYKERFSLYGLDRRMQQFYDAENLKRSYQSYQFFIHQAIKEKLEREGFSNEWEI
jgi:hypothetical protein